MKGKSKKAAAGKRAISTALGPAGIPLQADAAPEIPGFLPVRWSFLLMALVLGYFGSFYWFDHHPHWWKGLPFQLFSLLFLLAAFPHKGSTVVQGLPASPAQDLAGPKGFPWRLVLLAATLCLGYRGQSFLLRDQVPQGLAWWGVALLLFFLFTTKKERELPDPERLREWTPMVLLVVLAAVMRFPFLWQHCTGLQVDEGHCVVDGFQFAEGVLESPFVTTAWGANASFHFWWLGRFMEVFGTSLAAARGFSALVSLGTLLLFYHLSRCFFGKAATLTAAVWLSFGWWFLFYSLSPFQDMLVAFWELATFLFLFRALRHGRKSDFVWTGLFLAMMEMEYLPGRLGVGMVALIVLGIMAVEGKDFLIKNLKGLSLSFFVMLWWTGPFIRYFIKNFEYCMGRSKNLNLLAEVQRTGNYSLIWEKWYWTFLSLFHRNHGTDLRFSAQAPLVDPLLGAFLLLGLGLLLFNLRKRAAWFILSGFFFGLFANAMAIQGQDPDVTYVNGQRFFIVLPFAFLLVAWGLDHLFRWVRKEGRIPRWIWMTFLALLTVIALRWDAKVYYQGFRDFKNCTSYWGDLGFNHIEVGEFIDRHFPDCHLLVDWEYDSSTVQVITRGKARYQTLAAPLPVPFDRKADRDVMIVLLKWNLPGFQEAVRKTYPGASTEVLPDAIGNKDLLTIRIPKADIEASQKGMVLKGEFP